MLRRRRLPLRVGLVAARAGSSRGRGGEPAGSGGARLGARGDRRSSTHSRRCSRSPRAAACSSHRRARARGSCTATGRSAASATIGRRPGRRSAASSSSPAANELAALEPDGDVRWTLARPAVRFPRWGGTATDTRIAYLTGSRLHVVAGDGTGDDAVRGLPAAARGRARLAARRRDARAAARLRRQARPRLRLRARQRLASRSAPRPARSRTSSRGRATAAGYSSLAPRALRVYDLTGALIARDDASGHARDVDAAFLPGSARAGRGAGGRRADRCRRSGATAAAALPDHGRAQPGRRCAGRALAARRLADRRPMGLRIRPRQPPASRAVANIASQLGGFPSVGGWCCASGP